MSGVMASEARDVAETIRRSLEHRPELGSDDEPPITASAGIIVVEIPAAIRPLQALTAADHRVAERQEARVAAALWKED